MIGYFLVALTVAAALGMGFFALTLLDRAEDWEMRRRARAERNKERRQTSFTRWD